MYVPTVSSSLYNLYDKDKFVIMNAELMLMHTTYQNTCMQCHNVNCYYLNILVINFVNRLIMKGE